MSREGQRALAITADGEPEFGGMVGERILVLRERFVVAGVRRVAQGSFEFRQVALRGDVGREPADGRFAAESATTALLTMSATAEAGQAVERDRVGVHLGNHYTEGDMPIAESLQAGAIGQANGW